MLEIVLLCIWCIGRILNRFSKDVGFLDDVLPYVFCETVVVCDILHDSTPGSDFNRKPLILHDFVLTKIFFSAVVCEVFSYHSNSSNPESIPAYSIHYYATTVAGL